MNPRPTVPGLRPTAPECSDLSIAEDESRLPLLVREDSAHDMLMTTTMETYALTTTTYQRRSLFVRTENAELMVTTLFHYRDQGRYQLHGFVVMPEHLHVLLTPSLNQTIERCAQCIKGGFSHEVRSQFAGEVWQPGFHEHRVRDGGDFRGQLGYIATNPEKRRLVGWEFVHTRFLESLDPMPERLGR
ncbi:MAG: transposase [Terracidiphilus sp.]